MIFDYYYNQVPIEVRCLAPWQNNKHADEIWGIYYCLFITRLFSRPFTGDEIQRCFQIKKYKKFRQLINPLIDCGFVSQKTNMQDICDKNMWKYEITELGIKYMKCMVHLICEVDI
mgnify:CR=1 FL=1